MRAAILPLVLMLSAAPAMAQDAPVAPATDDPLAAANALIQQLQAQLQATNAEVLRLQPLAAAAAQDKQMAEMCTAKNVRLVRIGKDILDYYDRRYRRGQIDPLQLHRRAVEEEVQALGDRLYDNQYSVPVSAQRPDPAVTAPKGDESALQTETIGQ